MKPYRILTAEVVVIDEQFGLRITEVNGAEHAGAAAVSFGPAELPPGGPPAPGGAAVALDSCSGPDAYNGRPDTTLKSSTPRPI